MARWLFGICMLSVFFYWGCSRNEPTNLTTKQSAPAEQSAPPGSPTLEEVNQAVNRVFKNAVTLVPDQTPNFMVADFNGDGASDLAVILKPVPEKLDELNQESPPWILKDPFLIPRPGATPLRIADKEILLAVIHGYGPNGWRDSQATQTYLLKNSVGLDVKAQTKSEVLSAAKGGAVPRLSGDLISESLRGHNGYLFFNGAQYSWYDPKTFKGEVETRLTHPGMSPRKSNFDLLHPKLVAAEK